MSKKPGNFGRDEMTALLGGEVLSETLTKASHAAPSKSKAVPSREREPDFSTLTTAQTAALLKKNDLEKQQQPKHRGPIVRAQRGQYVPNRHALLTEEEQRLRLLQQQGQGEQDPQTANHATGTRGSDNETSDDDAGEDQFSRPNQEQRRRTEPQIVLRRHRAEASIVERRTSRTHETQRRREYSSSSSASSASDDDRGFRTKRGGDSESDDSEQDDRRQRLLAKRRQRALDVKADLEPAGANAVLVNPVVEQNPKALKESVDRKPQGDESSNSDSSSDDEEGVAAVETSSSSEEESTSSADEPPVMAKPLFVPRHKRQTILSQEQKEEQEKEIFEKKKEG